MGFISRPKIVACIDDLYAAQITLALLLFNSALLWAHDAPTFDLNLARCYRGNHFAACFRARESTANSTARNLGES